jgi:3-oxoacyl-[acyl-carrier protein] reductase
MDLELNNRVALVTAASRGLGRAVALRLAQEGARVAICARGKEQLDEAASEIASKTGQQVIPIQADVSDPSAVDALINTSIERLGRLDVLIINAGGPPAGQFLDLTPGDWEAATRLTLMSAVRLLYAAVPVMQEQGEGSILAITSIAVKQPLPNLVLSNSLRLGIIGLIKTLADELASSGIRVNGICPGWTRTDRVDQLLRDRARRQVTTPEEEAAKIAIDIPMGRMGKPEEFAKAAAFLVSPAASYITGVSLLVDGGMYRGVL